MFYDILIFLPAFLCLFWMMLHAATSFRTWSFPALMVLLADLSVCFAVDAFIFATFASPRLHVWTVLVAQVAAPSLVPLAIYYLKTLRHAGKRIHMSNILWVAIPAAFFTACAVITGIAGQDAIAEFIGNFMERGVSAAEAYRGTPVYSYYRWSILGLGIVTGAEILYMGIYMIVLCIRDHYSVRKLVKFLFGGEQIDVAQIQVYLMFVLLLVVVVKVTFVHVSGIISAISSLLVYIFGYAALFGARKSFSLKQAANVMRYNFNPRNRQAVVEEMISDLLDDAETEALSHIRERLGETPELKAWEQGEKSDPGVASAIFSAVAGSWDENSLMARFQRLMVEEQLYLKPGLSLTEIAERLDSNTTYISKMVNNSYNLSFPELLNTLRIDYAEHYILLHRDAKQDEIARECGFLSASSFNTVFKKITGMTPKVWVASRQNENRK